MRKVLTFSLFLLVGLAVSQILPQVIGEAADTVKTASDMLLYICLAFIMINVGREFEIDKTKWRSYALDYFIAMITAAMPWILICIYYVLALLPHEYWSDWEAMEGNSADEPFRRSYLCRNSFYHACGIEAEVQLDVQEDSGSRDFR